MQRKNNDIYNPLSNANLENTPDLNDDEIREWGNESNIVLKHYQSYVNQIKIKEAVGPIERHPYIDRYRDDFDLNSNFLLLGTMPPSSYFNHLGLQGLENNLNISNKTPLDYYYGNMKALWKYLGFGDNLTVDSIRSNLRSKSIAISDVLSYVQRSKMTSSNDGDIWNIVLNKEVLHVFSKDSKIKTILTTSGSLKELRGNANSLSVVRAVKWIIMEFDDLKLFSISGEAGGDGEYFPINNLGIDQTVLQQNKGIEWWLKKGDKKIQFINLPSPSGIAGTKMITSGGFFERWVRYKARRGGIPEPDENQLGNLNAYMKEQYPQVFTNSPTTEYRRDIYQKALNNELNKI